MPCSGGLAAADWAIPPAADRRVVGARGQPARRLQARLGARDQMMGRGRHLGPRLQRPTHHPLHQPPVAVPTVPWRTGRVVEAGGGDPAGGGGLVLGRRGHADGLPAHQRRRRVDPDAGGQALGPVPGRLGGPGGRPARTGRRRPARGRRRARPSRSWRPASTRKASLAGPRQAAATTSNEVARPSPARTSRRRRRHRPCSVPPPPARPAPPPDGTASDGSSGRRRLGTSCSRALTRTTSRPHPPPRATAGLVHGEEPGDSRPDLKDRRRGGEGPGARPRGGPRGAGPCAAARPGVLRRRAGPSTRASRSCRCCWSPAGDLAGARRRPGQDPDPRPGRVRADVARAPGGVRSLGEVGPRLGIAAFAAAPIPATSYGDGLVGDGPDRRAGPAGQGPARAAAGAGIRGRAAAGGHGRAGGGACCPTPLGFTGRLNLVSVAVAFVVGWLSATLLVGVLTGRSRRGRSRPGRSPSGPP